MIDVLGVVIYWSIVNEDTLYKFKDCYSMCQIKNSTATEDETLLFTAMFGVVGLIERKSVIGDKTFTVFKSDVPCCGVDCDGGIVTKARLYSALRAMFESSQRHNLPRPLARFSCLGV